MIGDSSSVLFTAKDIERILGINANTLYHWIQDRGLMKPAIEGYGRGRVHKFSLENLATLTLIKVLNNHRIDLLEIKDILKFIVNQKAKKVIRVGVDKQFDRVWFVDKRGNPMLGNVNIWQAYKTEKELLDKVGLILTIHMPMDREKQKPLLLIFPYRASLFKTKMWIKFNPRYVSCLAVNLIEIIKKLEKKTGLEF